MIIKKSTQQIAQRDVREFGPARGPRFITGERRSAGTRGDLVEISDEARRVLAEKSATPLARSVREAAPGAAALLPLLEKGHDAARLQLVRELRADVVSGRYDFDDEMTAGKTADRLARVFTGAVE